jgi:hypothetical protein
MKNVQKEQRICRKNEEYAEKMKNSRKKFLLSTMPGDFKGTVFQKYQKRCSILA